MPLKSIPLPGLIFLTTLIIGLSVVSEQQGFISVFSQAFEGSLGYFVLILLPSFLMAASLSRLALPSLGLLTKVLAPFAGAGMICPDTAYAAMSPVSGRHKPSVAFGAYAGFKLLPPAGPLIIAAALGISDAKLLMFGFILLIPVWIAGEIFLRLFGPLPPQATTETAHSGFGPIIPLAVSALLILLGMVLDLPGAWQGITFLFHPAGAILTGALMAWAMVPADQKKECFESALESCSTLLLLIGIATAFGTILTKMIPISAIFGDLHPRFIILALFGCAAAFKMVQGSSMATFAAVAPVVLPMISVSGVSPTTAVYSIALGSFVSILPNDSYYWLTRKDTFEKESDTRASSILALGSAVQGITGLASLMLLNGLGWV